MLRIPAAVCMIVSAVDPIKAGQLQDAMHNATVDNSRWKVEKDNTVKLGDDPDEVSKVMFKFKIIVYDFYVSAATQ